MAAAKRKRSDASDYSASHEDVVSQDFKDALQDLSGNDRYQISNLTVIAKESTEHAMAISEVLLDHIKKVSPTRKLPAFYVLDSIVKNVRTPYTDFLSRNLFSTFMEAYTLVDQQTRKQMESMVKTWKEPVPGSTDKQPVFPPETTRPIDTALIKARTLFITEQQRQQQNFQQARPSSAQAPPHGLPSRQAIPGMSQSWSDSPGPQHPGQYNSPAPSYYPQNQYQPPPQLPYQTLSPVIQYQPPPQMPHQTHSPVPNYQSQFHPPPTYPPQTTPQPYNLPQHYPQQPTPQQYPPPQQAPPAPTVNYSQLAALLQASGVPPPPPQHKPPSEPQSVTNQFSGLEALFRTPRPVEPSNYAVNYERMPTPQPPPTLTNTPVQPYLFTPPVNHATLIAPPADVKNDVKLTSASLKVSRPGLVQSFFNSHPSQCATCGRRFATTPEGKGRKARHLDAHFRTNMKFAQQDAQGGRGVSRSWYVGEVDWISAREYDDADEPDTSKPGQGNLGMGAGNDDGADAGEGGIAGGGPGKGASGSGNPAQRYIKAPADAAMAKYVCPICQDEFNAIWLDEAQEWVWMDAVRVGDKVYHGSCLGEMAKDRGGGATIGIGGR